MERLKNKYLIIDITCFKYKDDTEIKNISDNIKPEHQKIVLKLVVKNNECYAYELLTGEIFTFDENLLSVILSPNENKLLNMTSNNFKVTTKPMFVTTEEAKKFYNEVNNDHESSIYQNSIREIFWLKDKNYTRKKHQ